MSVSNDIGKFAKKLGDLFKKATSNKEMEALGHQAIKIIVKRTRLGYGAYEGNPDRFKHRPLSPNYIALRKRYKVLLDPTTKPGKSNLTFTGQLLRSMVVKRARPGSVRIEPNRKGHVDPFTDEASTTNYKLAKSLADRGRPFNYLTRPETKQLRIFYRRMFADLVKKNVR